MRRRLAKLLLPWANRTLRRHQEGRPEPRAWAVINRILRKEDGK